MFMHKIYLAVNVDLQLEIYMVIITHMNARETQHSAAAAKPQPQEPYA